MALNRLRRFCGANSAMIAPPVATIMPTPSPVAKRKTPNTVMEPASAVSPMPTENQAMAVSITLRRPRRSPTAPADRAPIITPIMVYEPSEPATAGLSAPIAPSSAMRVGRTAP